MQVSHHLLFIMLEDRSIVEMQSKFETTDRCLLWVFSKISQQVLVWNRLVLQDQADFTTLSQCTNCRPCTKQKAQNPTDFRKENQPILSYTCNSKRQCLCWKALGQHWVVAEVFYLERSISHQPKTERTESFCDWWSWSFGKCIFGQMQ